MVHLKAIPEGGSASAATSPLPYTFYDRYTPIGARRVDRRQPLPSVFAARFLQGGGALFATDYVMWREAAVPETSGCMTASSAMPVSAMVRFDEDENPTTLASTAMLTSPATAAVPTISSALPPLTTFATSGWMFLNLDNRIGVRGGPRATYSSVRASQNWVVVRMRAEGRFGVDYDATPLGNGCVPQAVTQIAPPSSNGATR
jgi:hypothetical protein